MVYTCQQMFILTSWPHMLKAERKTMLGLEVRSRQVTFSHSGLCSSLRVAAAPCLCFLEVFHLSSLIYNKAVTMLPLVPRHLPGTLRTQW